MNCIKLSFVGDTMPSGVLYGETRAFASKRLLNLLSDADVRIGNLECALGSYCDTPSFDKEKMSRLKDIVWAIDEDISRIKQLNINMVSLANNHVFDLGKEGLQYTIQILDENGIKYFGAGNNIQEASEPAVIDVKGMKIAVLGFCDYRDETVGYIPFADENTPGINPLYPLERTCSVIKQCKTTFDYVFVVPHWGVEHTWIPTETVLRDIRTLINAGADAVIGGHPHRMQSHFTYKGKPCYPSLGNFFFPDRYLNTPRPTWYPPKGTDTSNYERKYGYPWVTKPTIKLWPREERVGMIAEITIRGNKVKSKARFSYLNDDNFLDLLEDTSEVLSTKDLLWLNMMKFLSKNINLYRVVMYLLQKAHNMRN